jgi:hypothetical protein
MTLEELDIAGKKYYAEYDYQNALLCYAQAFARYPKLPIAYNNYAMILRAIGETQLSYNFFQTAIDLDPDDRNFPFNLATAHLLAGDLPNGWGHFETRWRFKHHENVLTMYKKPRWEGQSLEGKKLLVTCEEGAGDNIQFARFTKELHDMGASVIHCTEPELKSMFTASFPYCKVIDNTEKLPRYDYWTPILSIPKVLRLTYDSIKEVDNYIRPSVISINKWNNILNQKTKFRVGFCWNGRTRNYPFEKILALINHNPDFEWINLQVICDIEERKILQKMNVKDYSSHISNWDDTAALVQTLDAFVSIDTGLCHLAGSMSIPCFLLLDRFNTCWRWLLNKTDTKWYKSMQIVRQQIPNQYDDQLITIDKNLRILATKKGS